ncbi:MAG: hypothetical protein RML94_03475 [Bacteroidia bacterium]|nr:hypothetical protein [Bacteroidia bacterium]
MGITLRVCPQGRRATGCAIASVLRTADAPSACLTHAAGTLTPLIQTLTL